MTRRTFHCVEGSSNKFWAVWVEGTTLHVHFGKIGTKGQMQQKPFGSEAEANKAAEKLILEKTKKGYREVESPNRGEQTKPTASQISPPTTQAKPTARPFDFAACKQQFIANPHQLDFLPCQEKISPEEAYFWLLACNARYGPGTSHENDRAMRELTPEPLKARPTLERVQFYLNRIIAWELKIPLILLQSNCLAPPDFLSLLCSNPALHLSADGPLRVAAWLQSTYLPNLDETALETGRAALREQLHHPELVVRLTAALLASSLGMTSEVNSFFAQMKKGTLNASLLQAGWGAVIFSLSDPVQMVAEARRLGLRLSDPTHAHTWLERTGTAGLDILRDSILAVRRSAEMLALLEVLLGVTEPPAALPLLELKMAAKSAEAIAQIDHWFRSHPEATCIGLESLRDEVSTRGEAVRAMLGTGPTTPLGSSPTTPESSTDRPVPGDRSWLPAALASVKKVKNIPFWVDFATLPPLPDLPSDEVPRVLTALMESTLTAPHPLVAALRRHGDRSALAAFAWALFERWQAAASPSKEKWALLSLGHFGDDSCVMKLAPLIRVWPGESQHQRAVTGLEILRTIGSDVALMQLNGMALKLKFKALQDRARQMMDLIAQDRGLSREQLEDRIVPDLGLEADGSRTLDFGPRRFRIVFENDLSPTVADETGKMLKDLPKPGTKDDAARAAEATEFWKTFKKQWRETLKIQLMRLEQAMITGRQWSLADWQTLLVRHPVLQQVVRRLVWQQGNTLFRVDEHSQPRSHDNSIVTLVPSEPIRLAHRLQMSEGQLSAWRVALNAVDIQTPFEQLDRRVFVATASEGDAVPVPPGPIASVTLRSKLEDRGWRRLMHDQGGITGFSKVFPQANVTAVVLTADTILIGMMDDHVNGIAQAYFVAGTNHPHGPCSDEVLENLPRLPTMQVDPVAYSETVRDLMALAPSGKA